MNSVPVFVGLDYHSQNVQVCVLDAQGQPLLNRSLANDWQEIHAAVTAKGQVRRVAIEACCGAAELAQQLSDRGGWQVDLGHPGYMARMKQGPDKSDFTDSCLAADLTRVGYLPKVWLAPANIRELRRLVRYRQQLVDQQRDVKLRMGALLRDLRLRSQYSRWSKDWLAWVAGTDELPEHSRWIMDQHLLCLRELARQIKKTEQRLTAATADDPAVKKLLSFRGIGRVTAWALRAEVGRFDRFRTGKQLAKFCGLSPCNASTGAKQADAGLIFSGSRLLKSVLIEAAHRLRRLDPRWRELGDRLTAAGKNGSVVSPAVANRWVRWLFHQLKEVA
jgi:transposase